MGAPHDQTTGPELARELQNEAARAETNPEAEFPANASITWPNRSRTLTLRLRQSEYDARSSAPPNSGTYPARRWPAPCCSTNSANSTPPDPRKPGPADRPGRYSDQMRRHGDTARRRDMKPTSTKTLSGRRRVVASGPPSLDRDPPHGSSTSPAGNARSDRPRPDVSHQ